MAKTYEFDAGQEDIAVDDKVITESEVVTTVTRTSIASLESELVMVETMLASVTAQKNALTAKIAAIKTALEIE